jgi:hypothetical protein
MATSIFARNIDAGLGAALRPGILLRDELSIQHDVAG